jgi:hypothetical protein
MTDIIQQSEADRIVARGREERASKMAQGLKPSEEKPTMNLAPAIRQENRAQYEERCSKHGIAGNFKDSDK